MSRVDEVMRALGDQADPVLDDADPVLASLRVAVLLEGVAGVRVTDDDLRGGALLDADHVRRLLETVLGGS